eukprot:TRINITY_DN2156_c0_g1_i2.p2 TRINITY_DN2156_c0_g1~~TRINITY_DN2156_c0_g1_i2.p2  ORF type:complete len:208 (+),score=41.82 TRINITY_DN2156_c0_g1_i2:151-774(+)
MCIRDRYQRRVHGYLDGTTDVTRTLHFGTPSEEEKEAFTLVLLGNLDVERTTWPIALDINGADLDVLARRRLWEKFMDYNHGTGHGVGYFSVVHEDPCGIAKYVAQPFIKGMVVSNEPGYYKENCFGIRIENCLMVIEAENKNFLKFRNLTLCPYDRKLIKKELLSEKDIEYINNYHKYVFETLNPLLQEQGLSVAQEWLKKETVPL